jgi:hypothetical protein
MEPLFTCRTTREHASPHLHAHCGSVSFHSASTHRVWLEGNKHMYLEQRIYSYICRSGCSSLSLVQRQRRLQEKGKIQGNCLFLSLLVAYGLWALPGCYQPTCQQQHEIRLWYNSQGAMKVNNAFIWCDCVSPVWNVQQTDLSMTTG